MTEAIVETRIAEYIQAQLPAAGDVTVHGLRRSAVGHSRENWLFDAEWLERGEKTHRKLILRRDPTAGVIEAKREIEFEVLNALREKTSFPVPRVYWIEKSGDWLDRPFMVMERMEGQVDRGVLNNSKYPLEMRAKLARRYTELLAELHMVDWKALRLSSLEIPGPATDAAHRQVELWEGYLERYSLEPQPILAEALCWLKSNLPRAEHISIVHGDFKPGNSLFSGDQVVAILDWELVHLGDPMEDLGWVSSPYYARENFIPGVWEKGDYFDLYEKLTGFEVSLESVKFYNVLNALKLCGILLMGAYAFCQGRGDIAWTSIGLQVNDVARLIGI